MSSESGTANNTPTSIVTTTETVVATFTSPPMNQPTGLGALLAAWVVMTTGTAATNIIVRIRQGTTTAGAQLGIASTPCTAATANQGATAAAPDGTTEYPAGQAYCVTVQQVAATGNGTMQSVFLGWAPLTQFPG